MALFIFLIITYTVTVISWHIELPEPSRFAFDLNEDDFEDYLDSWLEIEERKWQINDRATPATGCAFKVNGDLGEPQPVYLRGSNYIIPTGTTGQIHLSVGEQIFVTCTGTKRVIQHPNVTSSTSSGLATCVSNTLVSGNDWFHGHSEFRNITCSGHSRYEAQATSETCYGNNTVIRVGFVINNFFYPLYWSCFDQNRLEVLYAWYEQNPPNAVHQTGVTRPSWLAGGFFPGVSVNTMYTQAQQKTILASLVGTELAGKYITNSQHMARGHLAAKTDFIFATGQRATFFFINAAPQWQPFNAGNWNSLEQKLRARIGEAGYNTTVYTGTFGVTQLRDQNGQLVDIYLYRDTNNNPQIPVPLYFYKVVYEPVLQKGTAFVAINNPYYTETEVRALQFCTDHCRNNTAFNWIGWQPDRIDIGYSFCCTIEDFRRAVPHLPDFNVTGLLY